MVTILDFNEIDAIESAIIKQAQEDQRNAKPKK